MTMSRKSMLSSSSCSRNGLSSTSVERSSSGAMSERISRISSRISGSVISGNGSKREAGSLPHGVFADNHGRVDAEHAKRVVEDVADRTDLPRLADDQRPQIALGVEFIHIDCGVADPVFKGPQISGQFQRAGGSHGVADEALGVVEVSLVAFAKDAAKGVALLGVPLPCPGGVRA